MEGYGSFQALAMSIINGGGGSLIELSIYVAEAQPGRTRRKSRPPASSPVRRLAIGQ